MIGTPVMLCPNDALFYKSFGTITAVSVDNKKCLIELRVTISKHGMDFQQVVGRVRNPSESLLGMVSAGQIDIYATWIPNEKREAAKRFDVSWWRGGLTSSVTLERI